MSFRLCVIFDLAKNSVINVVIIIIIIESVYAHTHNETCEEDRIH